MTRYATSAARKYVQVVFQTPAAMVDDAAAMLVAEGALGCAVGGDHRSAHRHATLELQAYFERLAAPGSRRFGARSRRRVCSRAMAGRRCARPSRIPDGRPPGWIVSSRCRWDAAC